MAREPESPRLPEERAAAEAVPPAAEKRGPDNLAEGMGSTLVLMARLTGIGWTVALSIAAGAGGGYWLDKQLDTRPWLTIAGVALGAVVAFTAMIRLLAWASKTQAGDGNRNAT
jgi:hypothetical protein